MTYGLRTALNAQVPGDLVAVSRMDVLLGPDRRARPDVSLVDDLAASDDRRTCYLAEEVRLVIEVVGPDAAGSDRDMRPRHYAAAGIPTSGGSRAPASGRSSTPSSSTPTAPDIR